MLEKIKKMAELQAQLIEKLQADQKDEVLKLAEEAAKVYKELEAEATAAEQEQAEVQKTAERLLVELKGKFNGVKNNDFFMQADHLPSFNMEAVATTEPSNEAVAALIALGYKPLDAEKMVKKVSKPELSSEQLIREALKAAL